MKSPFPTSFFRKRSHPPPSSPQSSSPSSRDDTPRPHFYGLTSTSSLAMGQANGRMTESETSLHVASVTSLPPTPMPEYPDFHHAPHSAPLLSNNAFSTMPKALHRSLSKNRRGAPPKSKDRAQPTPPSVPGIPGLGTNVKPLKVLEKMDVSEELKAFEALVLQAEARAGIPQPQSRSIKRCSKSTLVPSLSPRHTPSISVPSTALNPTPPHLRSGLYRRNSTSSSIHSSRGSVKSSRRAEREWRAKVAALSSGFGPGDSPSKERARSSPLGRGGPVPPRRRANTSARSVVPRLASAKPESSPAPTAASLLPPHSSSIASSSLTPFPPPGRDKSIAKSIQGRKSFETLGHYLHVPEGRERQASVPRSVSVKEDEERAVDGDRGKEDEDGRERQLSVAASTLLALEGAGQQIAGARKEEEEVYEFQLEKPKVEMEETKTKASVPQHELAKRATSPTLSIPSLSTSVSASPSASAATSPNPTVSQLPSLSLPHETNPKPLDDEPRTPLVAKNPSTTSPSSPPTPYSPATAYILSAPIENLGWNEAMFSGPGASALALSAPVGKTSFSELGSLPERDALPVAPVTAGHPYTLGKQDSPLAPTPPGKDVIPRLWESGTPTQRTFSSSSVSGPTSMGVSAAAKLSKSALGSGSTAVIYPRKKPTTSATPASRALQPRLSQPTVPSSSSAPTLTPAQKFKMDAIGSRHPVPPAGKGGMKRVKGGIDLTPGMGVDGKRPGKSGLPRSDLERWLQGTAGACSA
ncbi:hypothetical protein IAR50_004353 [Cryptococcus sp. DSM 104548]